MEPVRLGRKVAKLAEKVIAELYSEEEREHKAKRLFYLNEYRKTIGFRRIRRKSEGNTERSTNIYKDKEEVIYLPSRPVYEYDDRTFRRLYKAIGQPIEMDIWDRLSFRPEDDFGQYEKYILQEEKPRAASSSSKRGRKPQGNKQENASQENAAAG